MLESRKHDGAFTLIELLVSIGIIALLIAITIPALGGARDRSRELGSSVNLRSIGQIFEVYIQDSKGQYPAPVPGQVYPDPNLQIPPSTMSHWQASNLWANLFLEQYPWANHEQMYLAPGATRDLSSGQVLVTTFTSYQYSGSFLGHPRIWSGDDIASDEWEELVKGMRQSMVRFPSGKVLMWDVELPTIRQALERDYFGNLKEESSMLFADGHTEVRVPAEANQGATNWAPYAAHAHKFLHNTREGVYGRDY